MLVITIMPDFLLEKNILEMKKIVIKRFKKHTYADHFPHCTLLSSKSVKLKNLNKLEKLLNNYNLKIEIDGTDIFLNDPLTNSNTLFLKIKKNKKIINLQKLIIENLDFESNLINKTDVKFHNTILKKSYLRYGYPFVGNHWIPHFTIASINSNRNSVFVKNFLKKKINYSYTLNEIAIWHFEENHHKLINKLNFK